MILCCDIGNTNIVFGIYENDKLVKKIRLTTYKDKTIDEYEHLFLNILNNYKGTIIKKIVLSSVVPILTDKIAISLENIFKVKTIIVNSGIKTGLIIRTDDPQEVGADLVSGAVGVLNKYGTPTILVDLGTATKFIIITEPNILYGVSIAPGLKISADALANKAAQLPEISLIAPKSPFEKNTLDAMNSGCVYGCCGLIEGIIQRIEKALNKNFNVILTGGIAPKVINFLNIDFIYDENIVLDGLYQIYLKNKER